MLVAKLVLCEEGLEQPDSSVLPKTPPMNAVLMFCESQKTLTYHGAFGGDTVKPLQLWSGGAAMKDLARPKPFFGCSPLVVRDPCGGFTGVKSQLERSQEYTITFGKAIIAAFLEHRSS